MRILPLWTLATLSLLACGTEAERPRPTLPDIGGPTSEDMSSTPDSASPTCPDADEDGVCDPVDACALGDDGVDGDNDGVADACDICTGHDDTKDADEDGVPDGCDACSGFADTDDEDGDGVPDGCDACALGDDIADEDGDGVAAACDACAGVDDAQRDVRNGDFSQATDWVPAAALEDSAGSIFGASGLNSLSQTVCTLNQEFTPQQMSFTLMSLCQGTRECEGALEVRADGVLQVSARLTGRSRLVTGCLGEAYYGSAFLSFGLDIESTGYERVTIDDVEVSSAQGICPGVGDVGNGDFAQDLEMWSAVRNATLVESRAGEKSVRLQASDNACGDAAITGKASIPEGMENPALRWRWRGELEGSSAFTVNADGQAFSTTLGSQDWKTSVLCLSETARGAVVDVYVRAGAPGSVNCRTRVTRDIYVDDIEVVSAPAACP